MVGGGVYYLQRSHVFVPGNKKIHILPGNVTLLVSEQNGKGPLPAKPKKSPKKGSQNCYHRHNRHCIFSLSRTRTFSLPFPSPFASQSLQRASSDRSNDLRYAARDDPVPEEALPGVGIGNMSDILACARLLGSAADGVGVGVGIGRDSRPCARRIWRGAGLGEAGVARVEIEDPDESLERVGRVGRLRMSVSAPCTAVPDESPPYGSFVWSSGLVSVKTSSSCGDRASDGRVVVGNMECRRIGCRGIGELFS
jgi:hypothetical protein